MIEIAVDLNGRVLVSFYFTVAFLGYLIFKLKGAHFVLMDYLWSFFNKENYYHGFLEKERRDNLDLERFKLMFGVRGVQSIESVQRAVRWSKRLSVSLRELGKAGKWVDWDRQEVKEPTKSYGGGVFGAALLVLMLLIISVGFSLSSRVLVQFKESKVWAWQGEDYFSAFALTNKKDWVLRKKDCFGGFKGAGLPLKSDEIDYMCMNMGSESYLKSFRSGITAQKYFGIFSFFVFLYFLIVFKIELSSFSTASRIYKLVNKQ
ncbi:DUF6216 family protein [Alcaligenes faecalis]|uniref:DUF6216 family protein n=1 Tax=Alcaligenes faecalis TaxID=511 RepID=UPI00214FAFF6|nr:DUF6216 family protein [Alcaligenes faecalis]MCR4145028.1 DUF6216 family protein [Alcaligenes faecalis]